MAESHYNKRFLPRRPRLTSERGTESRNISSRTIRESETEEKVQGIDPVVAMYLSESHGGTPFCAVCFLFSLKYTCTGCSRSSLSKLEESESTADMEWVLGFLENPTIVVEWNSKYYQDIVETRDVT